MVKIIAALDGSLESKAALKFAASMPFAHPHFVLVNVAPTINFDSSQISTETRKSIELFNQDMQKGAEKLLIEGKQILKEMGIDCTTKILSGIAGENLVSYCESIQADLIAIGSRGLNPAKRLFLGSVSDGVVRHAPCSVLLFRAGSAYHDNKKLNLVIGYDDTDVSKNACQFVKRMDLSKINEIDLLSYLKIDYYYGMSYSLTALETWPKYKQALEENMLAIKKDFLTSCHSLSVNHTIITDIYDVADELIRYANETRKDLIVVGSKGKNLINRLLLGSVSLGLAHHANLPLLIVR